MAAFGIDILSLVRMSRFVVDPHYVKRGTGRVDLWAIGFLALGIGSLQVLLDTGQRKDWFSSSYVRIFTRLCVIGLVALVIREFEDRPSRRRSAVLWNRSFSAGVFLIGMLGFMLSASLVLLPLYLQTLMGCPAHNSSLALSPRGIGALLFTPLAGHLFTKIDSRRLLVVGLVLGSITMFDRSGLNLYAGFWDAARKALGALYEMVQQRAAMLAFVEAFWVMGVVFLLMIPFLPLLQYAKRVPSQEGAANAEAAMLLSHTPEPWPDVLEHDAQVEDGDLVPHA
jgi:hypothetical protein